MPNAPKQFRPAGQPSKQEAAKQYNARRGTPASRGYGARWQRFRRWYFAQPECVCCGCGCGRAATELDHIERVDGKHDERFFDLENVLGLTIGCHSRKTATVDHGLGNRPTVEGQRMLAAFKAEAKRRAEIIGQPGGYA